MRTDRPETPGAKADLDIPKPGTPADFRQRIDRLYPGHPSSPVEADGRRKPPPPRLRDIALPEPATDTEHTEHVKDVRDRLDKARAHGLATDQQHTIDPDKQSWSRERAHFTIQISDSSMPEAAKCPVSAARSWREVLAARASRPSWRGTQVSTGHST